MYGMKLLETGDDPTMVSVDWLSWSPGVFRGIFRSLQQWNQSGWVLRDSESVDHRRWRLVSAYCRRCAGNRMSTTASMKYIYIFSDAH